MAGPARRDPAGDDEQREQLAARSAELESSGTPWRQSGAAWRPATPQKNAGSGRSRRDSARTTRPLDWPSLNRSATRWQPSGMAWRPSGTHWRKNAGNGRPSRKRLSGGSTSSASNSPLNWPSLNRSGTLWQRSGTVCEARAECAGRRTPAMAGSAGRDSAGHRRTARATRRSIGGT